jgi:hypothetical protein
MERDTCAICRFWTGKEGDSDAVGECRRLAPQQVAGFQRPWPVTQADDWCHLLSSRAGIPGGRGAKLTNQEVVDYMNQHPDFDREDLISKLEDSGLPEPLALRKIERLFALGLLVEVDGKLRIGDGKPLPKKKTAGAEPEAGEPDDQTTSESAQVGPGRRPPSPGPRVRHSLDRYLPILRMMARPDSPKGFNEMFNECCGTVGMIGKGTFSNLIAAALQEGKIFRYDTGQFQGKYYIDDDITPP